MNFPWMWIDNVGNCENQTLVKIQKRWYVPLWNPAMPLTEVSLKNYVLGYLKSVVCKCKYCENCAKSGQTDKGSSTQTQPTLQMKISG